MRSIALTLLLLSVCFSQPSWARDGTLEHLISQLEAVKNEHQVPAFAFALVDRKNTLHANSYGVADLSSGRQADADTRFRIGSITKLFTALAVLIASERGLLELADSFSDIAGDGLISNRWAESASVSLEQLLEHTAGLSDLNTEEMYHSDPTPLTLAQAIKAFRANRVVRWPPGEFYSYSNAGAGLAAYALELSSGRTYDDFVREEIFQPLGMSRSTLLLDAATRAQLATGYDRDRRTPIPYWHMLFRPFGAINLAIGDIAPVLKLLLNNGRHGDLQVLSPAAISRMERSETSLAARHGLSHGYGLGIYAWFNQGLEFFGHGGDGDGYLAHLGYNRASGLAYCIIINAFSHRPLRQMRNKIERFIASAVTTKALAPQSVSIAEDALPPALAFAPATRRFGQNAPSNQVSLWLERAGKHYQLRYPDGETEPIYAVAPWLWRKADEPAASIAIMPNHKGRWVLQGMRESYIEAVP